MKLIEHIRACCANSDVLTELQYKGQGVPIRAVRDDAFLKGCLEARHEFMNIIISTGYDLFMLKCSYPNKRLQNYFSKEEL